MIELFKEKQDCCGCTACKNICPKNAISMQSDEEGFLYPQIDLDKCVECGLCKKVCAFQNGYNISENFNLPIIYAVKNKDEKVRMSSSSGGVFTAISDFILNKSGVVYGVAFDKDFNVVHQRADTKEKRDEFKGSKYVQSDLGDIFKRVEKDLVNNIYVIFTGTPCQCAALRSYLDNKKVPQDMLILCDIVCHGTPSPLMWKEHIMCSEKKMKSQVKEYYCRSKVKGWHGHNEMMVFENGKIDYSSPLSQKHKNIFYSHNALRLSCHNCKYTNLTRCSDLTIADFWGIEKSMKEFDDNKGVSLVLINTQKGKELFNCINCNLIFEGSNLSDCIQPQLQHPPEPSAKREQFWNDYYSFGYEYVIKKYAGYGVKNEIKSNIEKVLQKTGMLNLANKIFKRGN